MIMHAANGLHAICQAGIVHRDMKPANLFLRGNGTTPVGDFGIAIPAKARGGPAGTPNFMAPEQWISRPIDRHADIYALGVTAHLFPTGAQSFQGAPPDRLAQSSHESWYAPPKENPRPSSVSLCRDPTHAAK
jgi:eukaryotic-like serine/threonine-protein kinase